MQSDNRRYPAEKMRATRAVSAIGGLAVAAFLLSACAATYEPVDAAAPVDAVVSEEAMATCRAAAEAAGHGEDTLIGAAAGVVYGAAQGALSGALWGGNSAEGAAIGAAAGFVVGAVIGATEDSSDYAAAVESCMADKGYRRT